MAINRIAIGPWIDRSEFTARIDDAEKGPVRFERGIRLWTHLDSNQQFLACESAPLSVCHQLHFQVENYILNVKREHSRWGARKIKERLARRFFGL